MYDQRLRITLLTLSVLAAAMVGACFAPLAVADGVRAEMSLGFKATTPSTETGLNLDLRYLNADDREAKPPTISELALHLPEGTRIDPTAVPVCTASDEEIQARGRDACPAASLVGTGTLDVYLGAPGDPQSTDLALFNGPGQILEVLLFEGTNVTAALEHLFIEGTTIRANPVQVPAFAPPELRFAASRIIWDFPANGRYIVTPPTCPAAGWRTSGEFGFADGSSTMAVSDQACQAAAPAAQAGHGLRVAASPRTLVRGRPTRLKVRLVADDPGCLRGATVRVGSRTARTDRHGRATLRVLVRRPSTILRVRTRTCGATRKTLRTRIAPRFAG